MKASIIHTIFEQQAQINPNNVAVQEERSSITYANLNAKADALANFLVNAGICKDKVVGVYMESGINLVTVILANFKSGSIYMPLNRSFGKRRLTEIFEQSQCGAAVTNSTLFNDFNDVLKNIPNSITTLVNITENGFELYRKNEEDDIFALCQPQINVDDKKFNPGLDDSNYIFSTSGTTGAGKLILGSHKGLANFINWETKEFNIDCTFRVSQLTSITFDASLRDIFSALTTGGTVFIPTEEVRLNMAALISWLEKNKINLIHCVPSLFRLLTRELSLIANIGTKKLPDLKYIIMAGEQLYNKDVQSWYDAVGLHVELVTMYGTTETTLAKTFHRIGEVTGSASQPLHVGKPIDEAFIIIINNNQLCRIGEIGEVFIKSPHITQGYYNNSELTNIVFVQNPLNPRADIIYKTGDIGKYLKDRSVEIIGRIDDQIKINGVRIEPKEIEQAILSIDGVEETIIVPFKNMDGQYELICYYIGKPLDDNQIKSSLEKDLPYNLIPTFFERLDNFPLTINGKIDKKALPKPDGLINKQFVYEAPVTQMEKELEAIWEDVLGIKNIGRKVSFYDVGGNSLKSLLMISRIFKQYDLLVKLDVIINNKTVEAIARHLTNAQKQKYVAIPQLATKKYYDLSSSQKRAWILHNSEKEKALYNVSSAYVFSGNLNFELLQTAFQAIVKRHEMLRTSFVVVNGTPQQTVDDFDADLHRIKFIDLRNIVNSEREALEIMATESNHIFDLEKGEVFTTACIQLTNNRYYVSFNIHHIASDAWSMEIIAGELFKIYNALANNQPVELSPLKIQYKDYAGWQNKQLADSGNDGNRKFWTDQFRTTSPRLDLQGANTRPHYRAFEADLTAINVNKQNLAQIQQVSKAADTTLFMTFVALLNLVLSKQSGQNDITIGSPVAGREHPDLENQVGFYVNTVAIRSVFNRQQSFNTLLDDVRACFIQILKHQTYPFDQLLEDIDVKTEPGRNPLFDIGFTYIKENELNLQAGGLKDIEISNISSGFNLVKADIWFKIMDNAEDFILDIAYNKQLFNTVTINKIKADFEYLFENIAAIGELSLDEIIVRMNDNEHKLGKQREQLAKKKNLESLKFIVKGVPAK
ncbi:AMP-binding protein [Mucilaginibacter sp. 21P]|uniref:condensation domain-containing protein n=1 Tax=Mucilaginibacter sp. 21P TaxID=2778902 RepID=UPI001C58B16F|nr:condensation domain-containing protein [Mucilaginibacter sp. 21P]QXV63873.1 AMP-binding protein [Mucilaginibacter sp. 21P]